jgi:hypothetical protein
MVLSNIACDRLSAIDGAHTMQDRANVTLHCRHADNETLGDLRVRISAQYKIERFALAGRQVRAASIGGRHLGFAARFPGNPQRIDAQFNVSIDARRALCRTLEVFRRPPLPTELLTRRELFVNPSQRLPERQHQMALVRAGLVIAEFNV